MSYVVNDIVFMRSPLLNLEKNIVFQRDVNFRKIFKEKPELLEAIALASLDLYDTIEANKIGDKQLEAIINYWSRSQVRATPYGLFSGIGCCEFSDETELERNELLMKQCSVDYEWFYAIINKLESDPQIINQCMIKYNGSCYACGDRLINPYISAYKHVSGEKEERSVAKNRIKYTGLVEFVREITLDWVPYKEVVNAVMTRNSDVEVSVIEGFLKQLIDNEYLFTNLRSPLDNREPLAMVVKKLKKMKLTGDCENLVAHLSDISEMLIKYEQMKVGSGIQLYLKICKSMEMIHKSKNYMNALLMLHMNRKHLSKEIKNKVQDFADFMVAFATSDNETSYLHSYKRKFINKYGANTEVALQELLDETMGLGDPYSELQPEILPESTKKVQLRNYLNEKIEECNYHMKGQVDLVDEDIEKFKSFEIESNLGFSMGFELNVVIKKQGDGGYILKIAPCCGSSLNGKLINRFANVLTVEATRQMEMIYEQHKTKAKDFFLVDTVYLSKSERVGNICSGKRNYSHILNVGAGIDEVETEIKLSDIVVGYNSHYDRLYIKSVSEQRMLHIFSHSMLNPMVDNPYLRFTWEVSYSNFIHPIEALTSLMYKRDMKHIPQIRYKSIIILRETWILEKSDIENIDSFSQFNRDYKAFKTKWMIPDHIEAIIIDKSIYINTNNPGSMHHFYSEAKRLLKHGDVVRIHRVDEEDCIVSDPEGNQYLAEFVIQYLNSKNEHYLFETTDCEFTESNVENNKSRVPVSSPERNIVLGEQCWIYFKIYLEDAKVNDFLNELSMFLSKLCAEDLIAQFFFLRYADPDFHVRLRVKAAKKEVVAKLIMILSQYFKLQIDHYSCKKYVIDVYERELERYGGIEVIEFAEKVFFADSLVVLQLIRSNNEDTKSELLLAMKCIYMILNSFVPDVTDQEKLLNKIVSQKDYHEEFRKDKEFFMTVMNPNSSQSSTKYDGYREKSIREYVEAVHASDQDGTLCNTISDIVFSLMHMFCNRFKGDRLWERKVHALLRHTLHAHNSKMKYLLNKQEERGNA